MDRLIGLIVRTTIESMNADDLATLGTPEGKKAFQEAWPAIIDAFFNALCSPSKGLKKPGGSVVGASQAPTR